MYESPVLGKAARWVDRSERTTPPERDSALHSDWRGEETRTSDKFEIRRVCSKKGRESVECQTLLAPYKQGKAMRAKTSTSDSDFTTSEQFSDEVQILRVCTEMGWDSDECQTLKTAYNQTYIVGKQMRAKTTSERDANSATREDDLGAGRQFG